MSNWISVNDMLPAKPRKVLVFARNGSSYTTEMMTISGRESLKTIKVDDEQFGMRATLHVTHWMDIPEPPEKKAHD